MPRLNQSGAGGLRSGESPPLSKDASGPGIIWPRLLLAARAGSTEQILLRVARPSSSIPSGTAEKGAIGSLWHRQSFSCRHTKRGQRHRHLPRDSGNRTATKSILQFRSRFPGQGGVPRGFQPGEKFDYILFNDIGDTVDVLQALRNLRPLCQRHTRVLVTTYNHLWEPLVTFAEWIGMKVPRTEQNWLSTA